MNQSRLEWKVGLFVLLSLAFAAGLIMRFSKGSSVFTKTYEILLVTSNVGGIRTGASILMAGVQVGTVQAIDLDDSGKIVTMHAQILARFRIRKGAHFTIEQAGFLGDQYIAITPPKTDRGDEIQPGETVPCEEPFNLQEVARSAAGLLRRADETAAKLNDAVERIDQTLLSRQTLTNLSSAVANFRIASERALGTLDGVDYLVQTNSPGLTATISNLVHFSQQLDLVSTELQLAVSTNRGGITAAIENLQTGTLHLSGLLNDLQAGKGLAGSLLKDDHLQEQFASTLGNLNILSSNLSQNGLFWKPRMRPVTTGPSIYPGKNPSR